MPDRLRVARAPGGIIYQELPYLICTFFTKNYEDLFPGWAAAIEMAGYGDRIIAFRCDEELAWRDATMLKPLAIQAARTYSVEEMPVAWIDVDAEVLGPLRLFDRWGRDCESYGDLGIHVREKAGGLSRWPSGTLFFDDTVSAGVLLEEWARAAQAPNDCAGDQEVLGFIASCMAQRGELTIKNLPNSYTCVFDRDAARCPDPVIVHYQASRQRAGSGRMKGGMICQEGLP